MIDLRPAPAERQRGHGQPEHWSGRFILSAAAGSGSLPPCRSLPFPSGPFISISIPVPTCPEVGTDFDGDQFARTFKEAHVDSVTVFGTCHHGHAYYRTEHPCRHPNLAPGLDLTGSQIDALHRAGIRAPIYLSCQINEYAANTHPEWLAVQPDGRHAKLMPRDVSPDQGQAVHAGWQVLDMSSPYQDYLAEQIEEVLARYSPVDGIFLDMCWDQPSVSRWAWPG